MRGARIDKSAVSREAGLNEHVRVSRGNKSYLDIDEYGCVSSEGWRVQQG
jgi:hypothetical protein